MTQSDKDLLLKDISARLPYKMKFQARKGVWEMNELNCGIYPVWANTYSANGKEDFNFKALKSEHCSGKGFLLKEIKPILFPFSDITGLIELEGKEVCLMKELACILDFDGYRGYYTTWKYDEKKENVIFSIWGGELCRMDLKSFFCNSIKRRSKLHCFGAESFSGGLFIVPSLSHRLSRTDKKRSGRFGPLPGNKPI